MNCKGIVTLTVIVLAASLSCPLYGAEKVIYAGDQDEFGYYANMPPFFPPPNDMRVIRGPVVTWLDYMNRVLHDTWAMPFDMDTTPEAVEYQGQGYEEIDWTFGYSFLRLPEVGYGSYLLIRLKALGGQPHTDAFHLLYGLSEGPWAYDISMNNLDNGTWSTGEVATFKLYLGALPALGGGDYDLIADINANYGSIYGRYLDVAVDDDTAVDWIELHIVPEPGLLSLAGLAVLAVPVLRRRWAPA